MSLPTRNDKDYLEITGMGTGFAIVAQKQHASELAAIFRQRGLPCKLQADVRPGEDVLRFDEKADRATAMEILESYKQEKGS